MIAFLEGLVSITRETSAVISVGGVGLEVFCPRSTLERCTVGKPIRLETYLLVREDALSLFGFADADSLEVFKLLLLVSGVGPKLALAALSTYSSSVLVGAVLSEDDKLLSSISGVGKKTAERIVLELKNRVPAHLSVTQKGQKTPAISDAGAYRDAVEALVALGYREAQVRGAVSNLLEAEPDSSAENLIRKALAKLR
jgi:holliday junction DNA helicase RuvA